MKRLYFLVLLFPAIASAAPLWVHPGVKAAMEQDGTSDDFIVVDGQKHFTGYHPSLDQYHGARFKRVKVRTAADIPKEFDFAAASYSPVRGQVSGDCWAQGGVSAFELTVNFIDKAKRLFSVQDVIDCSGFGTARSGGQLSMKHFEKGAVLNADYPYTGRDARCRTDVTRQEKAKRSFYLRGSGGGMPTVPELQTALLEYGAMEVCGGASALGSGGWVDGPTRGVVNHCYALTGWLDGKAHGHKDTIYWKIKNSWGDCDKSNPLSNGRCWGDNGYGYYALSPDGLHLQGAVLTEFQGVEYKPMAPPVPSEFTVESKDAILRVVVQPGTDYSADDAKEALQAALNSLGGAI